MEERGRALDSYSEEISAKAFQINKVEEDSKNSDDALSNIKETIKENKSKNNELAVSDIEQFLQRTTKSIKRSEDLDFWKNDLHAILNRNLIYGVYLSNYCTNFNKKSKSKRRLGRCFFWITMILLAIIVIGGVVGIGLIFIRGDIGGGEVASIISAIVGMITAFLVLPKIIGDNLFPKNDDDKSADLFELVMNKDFELRQFYQQDKIREDVEKIFGDNDPPLEG
jgi:hypothetical protein